MSDCFLSKMKLASSPACSPITLITHFELANASSSSVIFLSWSLTIGVNGRQLYAELEGL